MNLNAFKLTIRNSFKNAFQSASQLFGLITLIAILSLIVSLITAIFSGVISNFNGLVESSNVRSLVVDMNASTRVKTGSDPSAAGDIPRNNVAAQQAYLYKLNRKYNIENPELSFDWSRTEERNFSGLKNGGYNLRVKTVAKTTTNTSKNFVDQLVIGSGHNIQTTKQTVIDATFARKNHIVIGDILRYQSDGLGDQLKVVSTRNEKTSSHDLENLKKIKDLDDPNDIYNQLYSTYNWFQVVGFGESVDYVTPTMDAQSPLANKNTELISYVHPEVFGLIKSKEPTGFWSFDESRMVLAVSSSADADAYYSLRLKSDRKHFGKGLNLFAIANKFNDDLSELMDRNTNARKLVYSINDADYKYYGRIWTLVSVIKLYNIIAVTLLILILGVVLFAIGLITRKQVEKTQSQIGLMKALGYSKRLMILNYSVLPFITSIIGSIIGFGLAQAIQIPIINDLFGAYFNLDFPVWTFDPIGFILVIFVTWLIISGIAFLIAWLIMRNNTLELINGNKTAKISKIGIFIKKISFNKKTMGKLRTSLLVSSLGKMSAVSAVVFVATILITSGFAAPELLVANQTKSYTGIKYKQLIEYDSPVYNNPYSFMQTFDPTNHSNAYEYANGLNKITGLPIVKTGTDAEGNDTYGYNMTEIINQLLTQKISSQYNGLEITTEQADPHPLSVLFANQKMLNGRGVIFDNDFLKLIANWEQLDEFGWNILNNQWPGYIEMVMQINDREETYDQNPSEEAYKKLMVDDFLILQNFYKTYIASVGLTVTRDFYYDMSDAAKQAYLDHDYAKQINFFNSNEAGRKQAFETYKQENKDGKEAFGKVLNSLTFDEDIFISDGTKNLPINSLYRKRDENNDVDQYLVLNPEEVLANEGIKSLEKYVSDYLFWYSTFISQRSGNAIIQAAYSRAPYFVKQMFKEAYNSDDRRNSYNFAFGVVPFNPNIEQMGLKISAQSRDDKDLNFNIYGIQNNNRFVDLKNRQGDDLIKKLFRSQVQNGIIINQPLAIKLGLKPGDKISFDVLYKELQNEQTPYEISDWNQPTSRVENEDNEDYFVSKNDLDSFSTTIRNPNNGEVQNISAGNMNLDNSPSEYYRDVLAGKITNTNKTKPVTFEVLGVHDGFGTMQAWMKNDDVKEILNYSQAQDYLWTNFFAQQFGLEFSKDIYHGLGSRRLDLFFNEDLRSLSYQSFLDMYVNKEDNPYNPAAFLINRIFNNAYPIFNYKYSLSDDIADLKTGISTFQEYGDYSPIAMNGGISKGVSYDGMAASSIFGLMPIKISQDILSQLTGIIQAVLILLIVILFIITFIIILLTTSLIISDNVRFIATMKVLGYTNKNIATVILGMYAIVIVVMFGAGYAAGWFIFAGIIKQIGFSTNFVLPLQYPIWLVFAVGFSIMGIYLINFILGYKQVAKNNATQLLQNQEI